MTYHEPFDLAIHLLLSFLVPLNFEICRHEVVCFWAYCLTLIQKKICNRNTEEKVTESVTFSSVFLLQIFFDAGKPVPIEQMDRLFSVIAVQASHKIPFLLSRRVCPVCALTQNCYEQRRLLLASFEKGLLLQEGHDGPKSLTRI